MNNRIVEIFLKEIFNDGKDENTDVTIKVIKDTKVDFDGIEINEVLHLSCELSEKHYKNAKKETGVDFKKFKQEDIFRVLAEADFEHFKDCYYDTEYFYDLFSERLYNTLNDGFFPIVSSYIGNGEYYTKISRGHDLYSKDNCYQLVKGGLKKVPIVISKEEFEDFDRIIVVSDLRRLKKDKTFRKIKKEDAINNFLGELSDSFISDAYFGVEEYLEHDINYYSETLDDTISDILEDANWSFVLEKLNQKSEEVLVA